MTPVLAAGSPTPTRPPSPTPRAIGNKSDWWTEDHPYMYRYRYKRFPNGSFVLNKNDEAQKVTWKEVRANLTADVTPIERFFYAKESRKVMKDVYKHVLMNLVPPSAHGSVMKRARIQKLQSKMMKSYFLHSVAIPGVKMLGGLIVDAIKLHYGGYIQRQMMFKKMATMSIDEIYAELNITPPVWDAEAYFEANRPNYSMPYEWRGLPQMYPKPRVEFAPYANYSLMYYSQDDDLPAPVLPALSYPWPWRRQLAETRDLILHVMMLTSQTQDQEMAQLMKEEQGESSSAAAGGSSSGSPGDLSSEPTHHRHLQVNGSASQSSSDDDLEIGGDDGDDDEIEAVENDFEAVEEFEKIVAEYHFSTGIPRILKQNSSYFPFPTLDSLLMESIEEAPELPNSDGSGGYGSHDSSASRDTSELSDVSSYSSESAGFSVTEGNSTPDILHSNQTVNAAGSFNATTLTNSSLLDQKQKRKQERKREAERKRKTILHEAMRHFYAYPSVDKSMVLVSKVGGKTPNDAQPADVNCSVAAPCLVQSGVTVFTPQLSDLDFFQKVVTNPDISKEQQRAVRIKVLQFMVEVAFQAEQKALELGIQAPSTIWYSYFDRNVDEFADTLQGHVNSTWRGGIGVSDEDGTAVSALDVYMSVMEDKQNSIFYTQPSYYWTTLRDTKRGMTMTKAVPTIEPLSEAEQIELLVYIAAKMKELDQAIAAFVENRNADEEYRQVVNATATRMDYEGSQYSTLGFGFLLPATNRDNVLYRELKLPVPFHLALRVLVRFQESRLLLQDESFHIVTCLAMLRSDISYYRCR